MERSTYIANELFQHHIEQRCFDAVRDICITRFSSVHNSASSVTKSLRTKRSNQRRTYLGRGRLVPPPRAAESKGRQNGYFKFTKSVFTRFTAFKLLSQSSSLVMCTMWTEGWSGLPGNPDQRGETPWYR